MHLQSMERVSEGKQEHDLKWYCFRRTIPVIFENIWGAPYLAGFLIKAKDLLCKGSVGGMVFKVAEILALKYLTPLE